MTVCELYLIKDTNFIQTELLSLPGLGGERRKQEAPQLLEIRKERETSAEHRAQSTVMMGGAPWDPDTERAGPCLGMEVVAAGSRRCELRKVTWICRAEVIFKRVVCKKL